MLTAEQREARRKFLGSSEIPAVLGLFPFKDARSAVDVYLEKRGLLEPQKENAHMRRGIALEKYLLDWTESEIGRQLERDVMHVHSSGLLCTNFDALVVPRGGSDLYEESVECKSTVSEDGWGEVGTDDVPPWVAAQVYHGFACLPTLKRCHIAVILPTFKKFDTRLYLVERDDAMVRQIESMGLKFMRDHVITGTPPDNYRPSMESLKRLKREPEKRVDLPDRVTVEEWYALGEQISHMKKRRDELQKQIITSLGDAEAGDCDGFGSFTYFEVKRRAYECEATSYRKLNFKRAK